MMYNAKLAVALKHSGKVLREFGDKVYVPFGAEYTILIKNMNGVRAEVTVSIDDTDVGDGTKFVIGPNESVELERFIKNGNLKAGNCFKFIERTGNIEEHRGIGVEDGLVRVEYKFEKKIEPLYLRSHKPWENPWHNPSDVFYFHQNNLIGGYAPHSFTANSSGQLRSAARVVGQVDVNYSSTMDSIDFLNSIEPQSETGITVPGSVSDQEFKVVSSFLTESETHVIVLQMLGETEDNQRVVNPVTVKAKPKCSTCGRANKATAKFCTECGTSLTIV